MEGNLPDCHLVDTGSLKFRMRDLLPNLGLANCKSERAGCPRTEHQSAKRKISQLPSFYRHHAGKGFALPSDGTKRRVMVASRSVVLKEPMNVKMWTPAATIPAIQGRHDPWLVRVGMVGVCF